MIYLVGVEHLVQWRQPHAPASEKRQTNWSVYSDVISEAIRDHRVDVVAEELNQEILDGHNHAESILKSIKTALETELGHTIHHEFVEPTKIQKRCLRYKEEDRVLKILKGINAADPPPELVWAHMVAHQFPVRESFWLSKLKVYLKTDILFVCGDAHCDTFPMMLEQKGLVHCLVQRSIGMQNLQLIESKGMECARKMRLLGTTSCPCLD
jgi:hypothetical protein